MCTAGESENYTEQVHLNNVFGARLRMTALRAAYEPGIGLLEYLAPRDGKLYPADEIASDLVQRQTMLVDRNAGEAGQRPITAKVILFLPELCRIQMLSWLSTRHLVYVTRTACR